MVVLFFLLFFFKCDLLSQGASMLVFFLPRRATKQKQTQEWAPDLSLTLSMPLCHMYEYTDVQSQNVTLTLTAIFSLFSNIDF